MNTLDNSLFFNSYLVGIIDHLNRISNRCPDGRATSVGDEEYEYNTLHFMLSKYARALT